MKIRKFVARIFSVLGLLFFRIGRELTYRHYFTFGGWVLELSIFFNRTTITYIGWITKGQRG